MKKCPFCAEDIQDAAIKCRYCHSLIGGEASKRDEDAAAVERWRTFMSGDRESSKQAHDARTASAIGMGETVLSAMFGRAATERRQSKRDSSATTTPEADSAVKPQSDFADVHELLRQGKKIHAIKRLREHTGWSLRRAKDYVETYPGTLSVQNSSGGFCGCLVAVVALSLPVAGGWWAVSHWWSGLSTKQTPHVTRKPPVPTSKSPVSASPPAPVTAPQSAESIPPSPAPSPVPPSQKNPDQRQKADAAEYRALMSDLVKAGIVKRIDLPTGKFFINGDWWEEIELDQKENLVRVCSRYRDAEYDLPQVTLYQSRSGKELASYGVFGGVEIEQ